MEHPVVCKALTLLLLLFIHVTCAFRISDEMETLRMVTLSSNSLCPEITCGSTNMSIKLKKSELLALNIDLDNIHLIDPICRGSEDSESNIIVQSKVEDKYCGTQLHVTKTHAIYKNSVTLPPDPSSIIYRETYIIDAACAYPRDTNVSLENALNPITSQIGINLSGFGSFKVTLALFRDPAYRIPHEKGDDLSTKDTLYIGVFISEGDTDRFDLVLKSCFATVTQNFNGALKYYIIKDGCPNTNDKTIHIAANGIARAAQVSIQAFKFLGGYNQVFLHCEVHLCDKTKDSCIPVCPAGTTDNSDSPDPDSTISLGSIAIKDPATLCPDLHCGASYINVTFNKSDLNDSNVDIENLHVNQKQCHDLYESGISVSIGWPLGNKVCGTTLTMNATHAIYKNSIYLAQVPSQIIYREEYFLNVSCTYPLDLNVSLHNFLNPIISTMYLLIEGNGEFEVIMAAFTDQSYRIPYKPGELGLSTKDRLYVGVFISKGDISRFDIVLQQCYATPTNKVQNSVRYPVIEDSCPNDADGTVVVYANGISSQAQFSFQIFKFINHDLVYLHCEIHLCLKSSVCVPICPKVKTRSSNQDTGTMSFGPIQRIELPDNTPTATTITVTAPKDAAATTPKYSAGKQTPLDALTILLVLLCLHLSIFS